MRKAAFGGFAGLLLVLAAFGVVPRAEAASAGGSSPALTAEQKAAVEALIRDYIRGHPEELVDALSAYQASRAEAEQKEAQAAVATHRNALERDPTSPVAGNPKGDVTVVEFFDYRCAYCKRMLPAVQELLRSDKSVRYVFKEYPILSPESAAAARAALAVSKLAPAQYLPFHIALMGTQGPLTESRLLDTAKDLGLDPERVKSTMNDPAIQEAIQKNFDLGQKLKVNGTPAFVVGDHIVPGAIDLEALRGLVAAARAG